MFPHEVTPAGAPPGRVLATIAGLISTHSQPARRTDGVALWPREKTRLFNQVRERLHNVLCSAVPGTVLPSRISAQLLSASTFNDLCRSNTPKNTNVRYLNILIVSDFHFYQKSGIQKQTNKTTTQIVNNLKALFCHQASVSMSNRVYT